MCFVLTFTMNVKANKDVELSVSAPSAILIEASTGKVIFEKNPDEKRSPASITKIMTLILIFEALDKGNIKLDDNVTVSAYASSMGGSQVFLAEGEVQTVETLIKCIAIASANDASVAMAEFIAGSEAEFVARMNAKAKELKMENTNFEDCCGLTNSLTHVTSARDVAIMSQALILSYPAVYDYTKIWMEDMTHTTKQGSSLFTLSSTNKLLKQYEWTTGLKTGSTNLAKYCLSATAHKNGIDLIAVVMAAPDYKVRFQDAVVMLEYGYSVSALYKDDQRQPLENVPIKGSIEGHFPVVYGGEFYYLDTKGNDLTAVTKEIRLEDNLKAPIPKGKSVGRLVYLLNGNEIGGVDILSAQEVLEAGYKDYFELVLKKYMF